MADVFVSYARDDKTRVAPLVAALEARGWPVWWDREIAPGQEFDRMIEAELARARVALVVWTSTSVESRWVRGEARDGADRDIQVPVRIGAVTLPIDFRAIHTIDLDDNVHAGSGAALGKVMRAVKTMLQRSLKEVPGTDAGPPPGPHAAGLDRIGICVLPFVNLGSDPEQKYLGEGISGDIITELARWQSLAVRSRSTSFRYRDGPRIHGIASV
ncbi:MAG TPA: TIR domain-containing protein [Woeseiaceae bacterium]|nr:TIR domain-containing protein [Woeseiaceae bacterium]